MKLEGRAMTVLNRVPVEAITARTPDVDWARVLRLFVALAALPFMLLGWSAKAIVFSALWVCSAVVAGYESGPSVRAPEAG